LKIFATTGALVSWKSISGTFWIGDDQGSVGDLDGAGDDRNVGQGARDVGRAASAELLTLNARRAVVVVARVSRQRREDRGTGLDRALVRPVEEVEEEDQANGSVHGLNGDEILADQGGENRPNQGKCETVEVADVLGSHGLFETREPASGVLQAQSGERCVRAVESLAIRGPLRLGEHLTLGLNLLQERFRVLLHG
jgi:hypothetical protein